jgi:hypothetical protein
MENPVHFMIIMNPLGMPAWIAGSIFSQHQLAVICRVIEEPTNFPARNKSIMWDVYLLYYVLPAVAPAISSIHFPTFGLAGFAPIGRQRHRFREASAEQSLPTARR